MVDVPSRMTLFRATADTLDAVHHTGDARRMIVARRMIRSRRAGRRTQMAGAGHQFRWTTQDLLGHTDVPRLQEGEVNGVQFS